MRLTLRLLGGYQKDVSLLERPLLICLFVLFLPLDMPKSSKAFSESCSSPLGLTSGDVLDWQLSASSSYPGPWDSGCHAKYARLSQANGRAWCSGRKVVGEWLLVDLGVPAKITGLITQGKCDGAEWVSKFYISYSMDAYKWHFIKDFYNNKKVFHGNVNSHTPKTNFLDASLIARFVRIHVVEWEGHPSLRLEILGCQECKSHISEGTQVKISASSYAPWKKKFSCQPYDAELSSERGWCARRKSENQWLQFNLGPAHTVTGIITKGRGDSRRKQWVRSYTLTYSNDSVVWFTYKDGNHVDRKIFGGNMDKNTERRHYLNLPFTARFVRINPQRWHKAIAMRVALLGCPHKGLCGDGFFRITPDSPCVENFAWNGKTWVNDKRHQWSDWTHGDAFFAVDGFQDTILGRCSVVQNFDNEEPIWSVDLGKAREVSGVVLLTWQGRGQDQQNIYRDYVFGLDKVTVFVERKPRLSRLNEEKHHVCATVTRLNNALFRERVHLECPNPIKGRHVYIKGTGVANRWHRLFSLVLCEVMVY